MFKTIRKILLIVLITNATITFSQNVRELTILHWNDFHSSNIPSKADKKFYPEIKDSVIYIGGSAYLMGYIEKYKKLDKNVILLNAGDDYQGSPVSTVTKGKSQIDLMNIFHPDAMTLGNHEFDYSADTLFKFLKKAKFDVISSNLLKKSDKSLLFKPYKVITMNGIKVGIIGLMTPELPGLSFPDNIKNIEVGNIFSTSRRYVAELKKKFKPDLIVLLSHCGVDWDEKLADSIPQANIIIGAHSHTFLKNAIKRNRTIICQAGDKGKALGRLQLKVDLKGDSIISYKEELIPTINSLIVPDKKMLAKVNEYEEIANKGLNEVIGYLETDWVRSHDGESNIGNWQTDVMKENTNADIAFQNSGGIRKNLSAGNITIRDIWEINPFSNQIVTFTISGDTLKQMLEYQARSDEFLQTSGIKLKYNPKNPFGERIISITINDKPLDAAKEYVVATNNYVANQGKKFFNHQISPNKIVNTQLVDRDLFIDAVKKQKRIDSKIEKRIEKVTN